MMVLRMGTRIPSIPNLDSTESSIQSLKGSLDDSSHIDQLDEPPIAQRMGIMAAFSSFDEFKRWALVFMVNPFQSSSTLEMA
ncbi:hypothetical protein DPMN_049648 [Dreissena polymorpha]|uniref:Uncharacterized protein n=1 Tax=Dreissena polymorpha TaxID=45954 RepID=A0A9D4HNH9_DREPO|nr:hypothetical protein DPMN_049648 [Dreissena polymorpha]